MDRGQEIFDEQLQLIHPFSEFLWTWTAIVVSKEEVDRVLSGVQHLDSLTQITRDFY